MQAQEIKQAEKQFLKQSIFQMNHGLPSPVIHHAVTLVSQPPFKQLPDQMLISEVKTLAREERQVTHDILLRIQEVERRKLYLDLGFPSILDWLVKDIGYSESAAYRRMQAARLLIAVPDAGEKLKSGEVSLSTLAKVQSVVKQEEKRTHAKIDNAFKAELIEQLESKSTREAEKILVQAFPEIAPSTNESLRAVSSDESRLSIILDDEVRKDLERAKELFSHIKHDMSWAEVVAQALKVALDHKDPLRKKAVSHEAALKVQQEKQVQAALCSQPLNQKKAEEPRVPTQCRTGTEGFQEVGSSNENKMAPMKGSPRATELSINQGQSRFKRQPQPLQVRRYVFQRDHGTCQYRDPITKRVCGSRHQIEVDHIVPVALGGTNDIANLRCLCRAHNQVRNGKEFSFSFNSGQVGRLQKRSSTD